ncbi:DUF2790 domain-containing protein [Pseudomonas duriflava]|nr:DUF2790 domain-containing protein [Pseudomonas duriflava]
MKHSIGLLMVLVIASGSAVAAQQNDLAKVSPAVEHYSYSDHLDIKRVIDTPDLSSFCGIRPIRMTYEDHQNHIHILEYEASGMSCNDN